MYGNCHFRGYANDLLIDVKLVNIELKQGENEIKAEGFDMTGAVSGCVRFGTARRDKAALQGISVLREENAVTKKQTAFCCLFFCVLS